MTGLYLHIPFCVRKCVYCDFYSLETLNGPIPQRLASPIPDQTVFLDALEVELNGLPKGFAPTTLFMGGGTPTELSDHDLDRLLHMLARTVRLDRLVEWTCESNPGTLTEAKAHRLKEAGVNRISMGVQSFQPDVLEFLGRIHGPADAEEGMALLRAVGFDDINLDLIYGVPGATLETTADDIARLIALGPEHASCYCLTFEEGTPLMDMKRKGYVQEADDESERAQYQCLRHTLQQAGYAQYEISNFARPGRRCRHNGLYWSGGEYIGCGPSAHSHWQGRRWGNVRTLRKYGHTLLHGASAIDFTEALAPEDKARETLVMWLRQTDGVPRVDFRDTTGHDYFTLCGEAIDALREWGLLAFEQDRLRLTEEGLFVSNRVFAELV